MERFPQEDMDNFEIDKLFNSYFSIFKWNLISNKSIGFDLGCGSGRWAKLIAPKVGHLFCIDPSEAIIVAKKNLQQMNNCSFIHSDIDDLAIENNSMDFGYSLGVLHHIPDTQDALCKCVDKLKIGAPFLLYIYYRFDNKPYWYKAVWILSDFPRKIISKLPHRLRYIVSQFIAITIYFPLARVSKYIEKSGFKVMNIPLSAYRNLSLYVMRTDALDRFGTRLEQRFTKSEIEIMMKKAGLDKIEFSTSVPYWCACGIKK